MGMARGEILASTFSNTPGGMCSRECGCRLQKQKLLYSYSQAVFRTLDNRHINSELIWERHQSLVKLAECNRVELSGTTQREYRKALEILIAYFLFTTY
jgi:hypothetical protein